MHRLTLPALPLLLVLLLLLVLPTGLWAAPPARPVPLRDNPLLQQKVTLAVTDRPLGDVLVTLTPTLKVDLSASAPVADQRVTLHLTDQPVYRLMERLPALLSHTPEKPTGYYWERQERPTAARPAFNLWRDLRSVQDEERELDYPRREAAKMLRDMRNLASLPPEQRNAYKSDYPFKFPSSEDELCAKALRGLSDDQLDALMNGGSIPLDSALYSKEIAAAKQQQCDRMREQQRIAKLINSPDPYPNGIPDPPSVPLSLCVAKEDTGNSFLGFNACYELQVRGLDEGSVGGLVIDPYDTTSRPDPSRLALKPPAADRPSGRSEKRVDLTPWLIDKRLTPAQLDDIGFNLQVLAKAAHITIYQEAFLKKPDVMYAVRADRLTTLKGTLPQLVAAICVQWNFQAQKVGDDYFFWSRTWASDRALDVPERLIRRWRAKLKAQGYLTADDHAEIAAALTWPQIDVTLGQTMPEGCCRSAQTSKMWHLLGSLTQQEREAAASPPGLPLSALSPAGQEALASGFREELAQATGEGLAGAVLALRVAPGDPAKYRLPNEQVRVDVSAGDQSLVSAEDIVWLKAPSAPAPRP